jgi:putative peptidoglycan lipid II flippase
MDNDPAEKATEISDAGAMVLPINSIGEETGRPAFGLVQSTLILTSSSILRIAIVFAQQMVLAAAFGARMEMDAFLAATTIPTLIMGVLIEQLTVTLIPIAIKYRIKNGKAESSLVVSSFINMAFIVLGILVLIGVIGSDWIIRLTVPGFGTGTEVFALTATLFRALLPSAIFSGLAGLLTGVFYAERRYVLASVASILNCLATLIVTIALVGSLGIMSAVAGLLIGSLLQFSVLFLALLKRKQYFFRIDYRHPGVLTVIRITMPLIGAALLYKASPVVDRFIASGLPEGSIAYLGYAFRIVNTLLILVTQGIAVSFFPILSERAASDDMQGMRRVLSSGVEALTFVIAPIATVLAVFGKPAIQLLLERGAFQNEATVATTAAILCYLGYLFAGAIGSIQTYALYSLQSTSVILKLSAIVFLPQIALSLFLSHVLGYVGLALSLSIVTVINMLIFFVILHKRLKGIEINRVLVTQIKIWFSCFCMAAVSAAVYHLLSKIVTKPGSGFAMSATALFLSAATGLACFLITAWLLKCEGMLYLRKSFGRFRNAG